MKKLVSLITIVIILFVVIQVQAQTYQTALGAKFGGYENGISLKFFTKANVAFEGVLGFRSHGVVLTGLVENHETAFDVNELKFYYGAGGHIGSIGQGTYQSISGSTQTYGSSQLLLGADAVVGLEYVLPKSPIAVSLDLNPRLELAGGTFIDIAPGLGIKYTF